MTPGPKKKKSKCLPGAQVPGPSSTLWSSHTLHGDLAPAVLSAWDALSSTSYFLLTFQDLAPSGIFPEPPAAVGEW